MRLSFFSMRTAHEAHVMPWTGRSRVRSGRTGAVASAGELIPRLVDGRAHGGVVERRGARDGHPGGALGEELHGDVLDAVERGELLSDGLHAVPARHAVDRESGGDRAHDVS